MSGSVARVMSASCQDKENIMTRTPTRVSTAVIAPESDCCMVWVMLSMSLVTRLMSSPRCTRSK